MVVVINNGETVKKFGNAGSAAEYADAMMRKGHDVYVMRKHVAARLEFI